MPTQITRRDFIHDVGIAGLGLALPLPGLGVLLEGSAPYYPPTLTGLRGAHPGSFEVAHAFAREGRHFDNPQLLDETYDLVVVGGGKQWRRVVSIVPLHLRAVLLAPPTTTRS